MNIQQIKKYWIDNDEELNLYKPSQLDNPRLSKPAFDFLVNCGLPNSCAPFLSFDDCQTIKILTPNEVFNIEIEELNDYLWIGSNGSGDPVCIDLNCNNEIVYLNHDNDFERVFINSSLETLSQCLIIYQNFIRSVNATNNSNYLNRNFSDKVVEQLKQGLMEVDTKCIGDNTMWGMDLYYM